MVDMTQMTAGEMIEYVPKIFKPEMAQGMEGVVQIKLSGDGGGEWYLTIKDSQCTVQKGVHAKPRITISASAAEFKNIVSGKSNATQAFMTGRLRVTGDLSLAMKLVNVFKI